MTITTSTEIRYSIRDPKHEGKGREVTQTTITGTVTALGTERDCNRRPITIDNETTVWVMVTDQVSVGQDFTSHVGAYANGTWVTER